MSTPQQVERLLRLAPYLQTHPDISVEEVAAALGVTVARLVSDLQVLMMCGTGPYGGQMIDVDLDMLEQDGRIRISNAGVLQRPMRFTAGEVVPLLLGLQVLRDVAGPNQRDAIDRATARLDALAGSDAGAAGRVQVAVPSASEEVLAAIEQARQHDRRLLLTYAGRQTSERLVDVHAVLVQDGLTYLQAWSDAPAGPGDLADPGDSADAGDSDGSGGEGGWRSFRLDRILDAEVTDALAVEHSNPPVFGWHQRLAAAERVVVDVDPRGEWVAEAHPVEESGPRPDDTPGLRLVLRIADRSWFTSLMLRLGDSARVIEPAEASEAVREAATAALGQYERVFGRG